MDFSFPYRLRVETISIGALSLELECLENLEQTIDAFFSEYEKTGEEALFEDLCPYFGVPWPAGVALAKLVYEERERFRGKRVLELGCGLAIPSLVLGSCRISVTATDLHPDVPVFLARNCSRNKIGSLQFQNIDWRVPGEERWDIILASDVLYDKLQPAALLSFLNCQLADGGSILLADPGRPYWESFVKTMRLSGWSCAEELRDSVFFLRTTRASARLAP